VNFGSRPKPREPLLFNRHRTMTLSKPLKILVTTLLMLGIHLVFAAAPAEAEGLRVDDRMDSRHDRRHDRRENAGDGVEDRIDHRHQRRDCVGDGPDCRVDNRGEKRVDRRERTGDRWDDRSERADDRWGDEEDDIETQPATG
jgi:hypothetical protein